MKIAYFDPYFKNDEVIKKFDATPYNSLDDFLKDSDFVSLHCPFNKRNERFNQSRNSIQNE